jgi:Uma2 family endonuclease
LQIVSHSCDDPPRTSNARAQNNEEIMSTSLAMTEHPPLVIHFGPHLRKLNDREFFEFCQLNRDLRIERTGEGDVIVMSPTGSKSGIRDFELTSQFGQWVKSDGRGKGFSSSTGFNLPNGATRSPDVSWIRNDRWDALSEEEQDVFAPICPDFVIELRSPSDPLNYVRAKMVEYIENGALLGWLIDPLTKTVYIYRPNQDVECLKHPLTVAGDAPVAGFTLDLSPIWD